MAEQNRGLVRVTSNDELVRMEREAEALAREAEQAREQTLTGLVGYIMPLWEDAKRAKLPVRQRLLENLRQRRSEYSQAKLSEIKATGGSEIYAGITSVKCRTAGAWLRDSLLGTGSEKPWTLSPTPNPSLPTDAESQLQQAIGAEVGEMFAMTGQQMPPDLVRERLDSAREMLKVKLREKAREKAAQTERIIEDELVEGGFTQAMDGFIDDFVTYPAAILKGPVVHLEPTLSWMKEGERWIPVVEEKLVKRFYRTDPFKFYPAPWAAHVDDGYCFEHHRVTREGLFALIGAPGYDEKAIREILDDEISQTNWLGVDWFNSADEINQPNQRHASDGPLDALEFYGTVPGRYLMEWGIEDPEVDDHEKPYNVNVWVVCHKVIKATINPDPLGKKPYRKGSYEEIPGAFWGNSVPDLVRDPQDVCNAALRALTNNMAMASGPQVAINSERIPAGQQITTLRPWGVHFFMNAPFSSSERAIDFFQPNSNAGELVNVFSFYSELADEYSGLPKYMSGNTNIGGAGRTASGLSSLMSNSNRLMKTVMTSVDRIITDVIHSLHEYLMQWEFDRYPELEGDVRIVARGAASVMAREQLALRRNEFLAATANPIDMQVVGMDGRAYLLREAAKGLELDTDRIVGTVPAPQMAPQPGQPGVGDMAGQQGNGGSPPAPPNNQRPVGATMDRPAM